MHYPDHPFSVNNAASDAPLIVIVIKEQSELVLILEKRKKIYEVKLFKFHIDFISGCSHGIGRDLTEVDPISMLLAHMASLHIINAVWQSEAISPEIFEMMSIICFSQEILK